ncbi:hypothetical protein [Barrientosiimonas humi]|uniref:hypothetical protein n=1 Tax=Barrientosiimonas humi TaxID=999931 RepID=UPI00370D2A26
MSAVSRRAVARGAVWSLPVVAVGAAAPTFAASRPCPTFPPGSDWNTRITAGRPSSIGGGYGWGGNTFSVFRDATTSGGFTLTSSTTISGLIAGQTYTMEVAIGWNYGNSSASSSTAAGARIRVDGTEVLSGQTRTADLGGTPGTQTYTVTFTARDETASLDLEIYVLARTFGRSASDDVYINMPTFTNCIPR